MFGASGQIPLHVAASTRNALLEVTPDGHRARWRLTHAITVGGHRFINTSQLLESGEEEDGGRAASTGPNIAAQNNDHVTVLHLTAKNGDLAATRVLLVHGASIGTRDTGFYMPLHSASLGGNPDIVRLLLGRGADLEAQTDIHNTPLHSASSSGNLHCM